MKLALPAATLLTGALTLGLGLCGLPVQAFQDKDVAKEEKKEGPKEEKIDVSGGAEIFKAEEELKKDDPKDKERTESAHHSYSLPLRGGKTYVIECTSKEVDSFLRLEDASGKKLAEDDDGAGYPDARIVFKCPKTDNYRIIVTTYGKGAEKAEFGNYGNYALVVRLIGKGGGTLALRNGKAEINDQLTAKNPKDTVRQNHHCKIHTIHFQAGKTYQIDMISGALDSYLRLEDADMKQLAQDDDGGGFPNARITFTCQKAGTYRIICTTFAPGETGPYTLKVAQQ
jgi:hypothetical protein